MIRRSVERVEAMILVFDLGTIGDHETDFAKGAHDIVGDLGEGMQLAERTAAAA